MLMNVNGLSLELFRGQYYKISVYVYDESSPKIYTIIWNSFSVKFSGLNLFGTNHQFSSSKYA